MAEGTLVVQENRAFGEGNRADFEAEIPASRAEVAHYLTQVFNLRL